MGGPAAAAPRLVAVAGLGPLTALVPPDAPVGSVEAAAPPAAPANTALPVVSGTAEAGRQLTTTIGSWSGSPSSYGYKWQDCNSAGEGCVNIGGAIASAYKLGPVDVGHSVRVEVLATNSDGTGTATSSTTATVSKSGGTPTSCFSKPEACGYPGPNNTGVEKGVTLTEQHAKITVTKDGETIKNVRLACAGCMIEVKADHVTIENVEVVVVRGEAGCSSPCGNAQAVKIAYSSATKTQPAFVTVRHVNCHGAAEQGVDATTFCFKNEGDPNNRFEYNYGYNTANCFWGSGIYENSYCYDNANLFNGTPSVDHYETEYFGGGGESLVMNHNTLFNPHVQTASVFVKNDEASVKKLTLSNNFFAGGGYLVYGLEAGSFGPPTGPFAFTGNRFARCLTRAVFQTSNAEAARYNDEETEHHTLCEGGPDAHGYFPYGGSYGSVREFPESLTTWEANYWDDNLEPVAAP